MYIHIKLCIYEIHLKLSFLHGIQSCSCLVPASDLEVSRLQQTYRFFRKSLDGERQDRS